MLDRKYIFPYKMHLFRRASNLFCIIIWSLCLYKCLNGGKSRARNDMSKLLLPGLVKPEEYKLKIFTNLDGRTPLFKGRVRITIQCVSKTREIILNRKNLYVESNDVSIKPLTDKSESIKVKHVNEYNRDQLRITLAQDLVEKNRYKLKIKFSSSRFRGDPTDSGFIVNYSNQVAYTNLNVFDARTVFPCFDQINVKAKYKVYLGHAERVKALTNAEFVKQHEVPDKLGWVLDEFAETVPMETFSVGIALLTTRHFASMEFKNPSSILIRVSLARQIASTAKKINDIVLKVFTYFSKLFPSSPYPFNKLDVVILPYNNIDTIDSYGLIILRDTYVYTATKESESASKFEALSEICNVISQQWIGHSVTMSWYDEMWLQEGLNYVLRTMCVNEVFPEMKFTYSQDNVIDSFLRLLKKEENGALVYALHKNPNFEISRNEYLAEQKLFHVVRMMHLVLGPFLFRQFLAIYAKFHVSSNSSLDDVWRVFAATTNEIKPSIFPKFVTAKDVMLSWTSRKGHPLIIVTRDDAAGEITIKQSMLIYKNDYVNESPHSLNCWIIPLTYTTRKEMNFEQIKVREWLTCEGPLVLRNVKVELDEWIIFSLNLQVMVRVNYDDNNWRLIRNHLLNANEYLKINVSTRVRLVSDMFVLAEMAEIFYTTVFPTMKYLAHERYFHPWKVALEEFALIRSRLIGTEIFKPYQAYMREILEDVFKENSQMDKLDNLNYEQRSLRISISEASCLYELKACIEKSLKIIRDWNRNSDPVWPDSIPLDVSTVIHCQKVKSDNSYWQFLWKQFFYAKTSSAIKESILKALGCSRDKKMLKRYLKHSINIDKVHPRSSFEIFQSLIKNDKGYKVMMKFFMKKYERIRSFHQEGGNVSPLSYLSTLLDITTNDEDLKTLIAFATEKKLNLQDESIKRSIANSRRHIEWFERHRSTLQTFFKLPMRSVKSGLKSFFKSFL